jgi:hypothetical protein
MSQWGKSDAASNSVLWAPTSVKLTPNTTNRDNLYGNTTGDAFITGATVGMFAIDASESLGEANVVSVTVTNAGSGFTVRPTVTFSGGGGSGAAGNTTAKLVAVAIGDAGTGYVNAEVVTVNGGTGTSANVTIANTDASGVVTAISIVSGQAGSYTVLPTLANNAVTGGSGSGLKVNLTIGLNTVTVSANGSGYTSAPSVAIGGTGGVGATATAVINTSEGKKGAPHAGWVLRTEGSGGRAGRVTYETLVAMGSIGTDNNGDDGKLVP